MTSPGVDNSNKKSDNEYTDGAEGTGFFGFFKKTLSSVKKTFE